MHLYCIYFEKRKKRQGSDKENFEKRKGNLQGSDKDNFEKEKENDKVRTKIMLKFEKEKENGKVRTKRSLKKKKKTTRFGQREF